MMWVRALLGGNGFLAAILAGVVAFVGWSYAQRSIGRTEGAQTVVTDIQTQTEKTNAKVRKARASARAPGAAGRVLKEYCRDC